LDDRQLSGHPQKSFTGGTVTCPDCHELHLGLRSLSAWSPSGLEGLPWQLSTADKTDDLKKFHRLPAGLECQRRCRLDDLTAASCPYNASFWYAANETCQSFQQIAVPIFFNDSLSGPDVRGKFGLVQPVITDLRYGSAGPASLTLPQLATTGRAPGATQTAIGGGSSTVRDEF
uniref:Apple domain-containing protein n=1 Tax=Macrostomum lignano TaxID=282301 RepID=A0A1I8FRF9_9PLAT